MQVPDTVEMQRHKKNVENFSLVMMHGVAAHAQKSTVV